MIIKTLSRHAGSTSQLLNYILRYVLEKEQKQKEAERKEKPFIVRHNLRNRSISGYIREFEKLESLREHQRSNSVSLYHHILSFSSKDTEHISDELLKDIAAKFIELRGEDNLYIGTKHTDKDHIHLHLAMSAIDLAGRSARISKKDFESLKLALDEYQREHYPSLVHSLPEHGKKSRAATREAVVQSIQAHRTSEKATLLQTLESAYQQSKSMDQFLELLTASGYTPYYRADVLTGISTDQNRKYRFNRLGYDTAKLNELNVLQEQEKQLVELRALRSQSPKDRPLLRGETKTEREENADISQELEELQSLRDGRETSRNIETSDEPDTQPEEAETIDRKEDRDERDEAADRSTDESMNDRDR